MLHGFSPSVVGFGAARHRAVRAGVTTLSGHATSTALPRSSEGSDDQEHRLPVATNTAIAAAAHSHRRYVMRRENRLMLFFPVMPAKAGIQGK
jgi:hypothetical protein